jgi:hypothetical protein
MLTLLAHWNYFQTLQRFEILKIRGENDLLSILTASRPRKNDSLLLLLRL